MALNSKVIARRYAKALWLLAEKKEVAQEWCEPLAALVKTLHTSADLNAFVRSPAYSVEKKWDVLGPVLDGFNSPAPLNRFLKYLLSAGRFDALVDVEANFRQQVLAAHNSIEVQVETASPLSEAQSSALTEQLKQLSQQNVKLIVTVDPSLLAGLRVHLLGKTLDATLAANLHAIQQELLQAQA